MPTKPSRSTAPRVACGWRGNDWPVAIHFTMADLTRCRNDDGQENNARYGELSHRPSFVAGGDQQDVPAATQNRATHRCCRHEWPRPDSANLAVNGKLHRAYDRIDDRARSVTGRGTGCHAE